MKIYFCDGCNESIPLQDIRDNKAVTLKGKIYCRDCNPLKDIQAPAQRPLSSGFTLCLMFLIVILLGVVIALMLWNGKSVEVDYATVADLKELGRDIHDLQESLGAVTGRQQVLEESLTGRESRFSKIESDLVVLSGDLRGVQSQTENMAENFQSLTNAREKLNELLLKQDEFSTSLESIEKNLGPMRTQAVNLEQRLNDLSDQIKAGVLAPIQGAVPKEPSESQESAVVLAVKSKLTSKDAGERFEAVYQVLDERLKEALPYVLPLIEDPDQFVQVGAIQTVGEFLYLKALPNLVKVLRDPDITVRDEALRQLIRMSGQTGLEFDVRGSDSEREKAVRKWEKWVKENS